MLSKKIVGTAMKILVIGFVLLAMSCSQPYTPDQVEILQDGRVYNLKDAQVDIDNGFISVLKQDKIEPMEVVSGSLIAGKDVKFTAYGQEGYYKLIWGN